MKIIGMIIILLFVACGESGLSDSDQMIFYLAAARWMTAEDARLRSEELRCRCSAEEFEPDECPFQPLGFCAYLFNPGCSCPAGWWLSDDACRKIGVRLQGPRCMEVEN